MKRSLIESCSCPNCNGPITPPRAGGGMGRCGYCGASVLLNTPVVAPPPLPHPGMPRHCECGRLGENRCVACSAPICAECSVCLREYDLGQILSSKGVRSVHRTYYIDALSSSVSLSATHCVACMDATLIRWLAAAAPNS